MPNAFRKPGGWRLNVDAVQHLMEQQPVDANPHLAQLERRGPPEFSDSENADAVKPLLHALADAVALSWFGTNGAVVGGGDEKGSVGLGTGGRVLPFAFFGCGQRREDALLGYCKPGRLFRAQDGKLREAG